MKEWQTQILKTLEDKKAELEVEVQNLDMALRILKEAFGHDEGGVEELP